MEKLKSLVSWLIQSSANPEKLSVTVANGVPFIILVTALLKLPLGELDISEGANALVQILLGAGSVLTGGRALWGLGRKVYLTYKK